MSQQTTMPMNTETPGMGQADLAGRFVDRFEGHAVRNNIGHRICKIGQVTLDATGQLVGGHTSSGTPLRGSVKNGVLVGTYGIKGQMLLDPGANLGAIHITCMRFSPRMGNVDGEFRFAIDGAADRLWSMSTGATILGKPEPINIAEIVVIEAIRIPGG